MMGNPWGQAADAYGQGLNNLTQIQVQGMNQQAQAPLNLFDRFQQGYMQAQQLAMQKAAQERADRLAEIRAQHEQVLGERYASMAEQQQALMKLKNMQEGLRAFNETIGPESTEEDRKAIESTYGITVPRPQYTTETSYSAPAGVETDAESEIPAEETTTQKVVPGSGLGIKARDILRKQMYGEEKLGIQREGTQINQQNANTRAQVADMTIKFKQALLDAGFPEAKANALAAQEVLARVKAGNMDMTESEKEAAKDARLGTLETGRTARAGIRASSPGSAPSIPLPKSKSTNAPAGNIDKAKAEFNALPVSARTPENKRKIMDKYGITG